MLVVDGSNIKCIAQTEWQYLLTTYSMLALFRVGILQFIANVSIENNLGWPHVFTM